MRLNCIIPIHYWISCCVRICICSVSFIFYCCLLSFNSRLFRCTWFSQSLFESSTSVSSEREPLEISGTGLLTVGRISFPSSHISVKATKETQSTNPNQCSGLMHHQTPNGRGTSSLHARPLTPVPSVYCIYRQWKDNRGWQVSHMKSVWLSVAVAYNNFQLAVNKQLWPNTSSKNNNLFLDDAPKKLRSNSVHITRVWDYCTCATETPKII